MVRKQLPLAHRHGMCGQAGAISVYIMLASRCLLASRVCRLRTSCISRGASRPRRCCDRAAPGLQRSPGGAGDAGQPARHARAAGRPGGRGGAGAPGRAGPARAPPHPPWRACPCCTCAATRSAARSSARRRTCRASAPPSACSTSPGFAASLPLCRGPDIDFLQLFPP